MKQVKFDAIDLLTADHQEVQALFDEFKQLAEADAEAEDKALIAAQICADLTVHAQVEEEIFYPAAREVLDDKLLLDEAEVEHASAKDLIAQIEAMDPDDQLFDATVIVLGEYIKHHVKEEQDEMFPKLRKTGVDLDELGARLAQRKEVLNAEALESPG